MFLFLRLLLLLHIIVRVVIVVMTVARVFRFMMLRRIGHNRLRLLEIVEDAYQCLDGVVDVIGCQCVWQMIACLQLMQYLGQRRGAYVGQLIVVIHLTWWCRWSWTFRSKFVDRFQFNRRPRGNWSWLGRQLLSSRWWFTRDVDIFGRNLDRLTGCGGCYVNGSPGCFVVGHRRHGM